MESQNTSKGNDNFQNSIVSGVVKRTGIGKVKYFIEI